MSNNRPLLIESQYLPPVEYFCLLRNYESVILEAQEHFMKQTFRNRCYILGANGVLPLIVPISHAQKKLPVETLEIDYSQKWQNIHTRAIQSAYGKSPFYIHYSERFLNEINRQHSGLLELNKNLLTICLDILNWNLDISMSKRYHMPADMEDFDDYRSVIHPKTDYRQRGILAPEKYIQMFGKTFASNLSILDLIFCEGPNTASVIKNSSTQL